MVSTALKPPVSGPTPAPLAPWISRLMDEDKYLEAAKLAAQARDSAQNPVWRRRYHGLYLFAASRLSEGELPVAVSQTAGGPRFNKR